MADNSQLKKPKLVFRVFSDPEGNVFLLREASNTRVQVERPVTTKSLEQAKTQLIDTLIENFIAEADSAKATTNAERDEANSEIDRTLHPLLKGNFRMRITYLAKLAGREIAFALGALFIIYLPYRGIYYSSDHFPELIHVVVLAICALVLICCVVMIATEENRLRLSQSIQEWFGPRGFLILPSLIIITGAAIFASTTFVLHKKGGVILEACACQGPAVSEPCQGQAVSEGSLLDFYLWHFLNLVPFLKLNEVLNWKQPLCYSQHRVGLLILLFQGFAVIPAINTVRFYWKNRHELSDRDDYDFDPSWQPGMVASPRKSRRAGGRSRTGNFRRRF